MTDESTDESTLDFIEALIIHFVRQELARSRQAPDPRSMVDFFFQEGTFKNFNRSEILQLAQKTCKMEADVRVLDTMDPTPHTRHQRFKEERNQHPPPPERNQHPPPPAVIEFANVIDLTSSHDDDDASSNNDDNDVVDLTSD